jgi:pimeloyl-ACP methyl ester carboxylesterase/acyl carrier protein
VESRASAKLWLITRGAQAVIGQAAPPVLVQAPVWGIGRVLAHEHPANWGGLIDLDPAASEAEAAETLSALVLASGREDQWIVRGGECYAARLVQYTSPPGARLLLDVNGTYLISGGLGEMGLSMADWLASRGARHLALVGRSAPDATQQIRVDALRQSGADVFVREADIANPEQVGRILAEIAAGPAPLRGVIHCAGVLDDGVILRQDESRLARVFAPKVSGAWELHAKTADCDLQFFVLCSSSAGVFGSPGQSNYAAANVFLDALALWRRAAGMPALSVQWGPWSLGMNRTRRLVPGLGAMEPATALSMLDELLSGPAADVAALRVNWPELVLRSPESAELPILTELIGSRPDKTGQTQPGLIVQRPAVVFERLAAAAPDERPSLIRAYLEQRINAALRRIEPIVDTQKILDLGMDSLMVVEVLNDCRRDLQIALYPREIYGLPNFGALTQYLTREFERSRGQARQTQEVQLAAPAISAAVSSAGLRAVTKRNRGMVFLLSSPRSGSTLLRVMLAGHPALISPPELHLLAFDTMGPWGRALGPSYLTEGLQRTLMELNNSDASAAEFAVQTMINEDRPVQQVYALLQDLAGARMLVDKSPTYGASLDTLQRAEALFEGARYIHLIRHPFAVIESFVRNRMDRIIGIDTEDPHRLAEQAWTTTNSNIRRFLQQIEPARKRVVRYEELVTDPSGVSQTLCAFLQIPFDEAMLKPYDGGRMTDGVHSRSMPIGDPGFLAHAGIDAMLAEAWRSVELPNALGQPARELARAFDYPLTSRDTEATAEMQESWLDVRGIRLCLCAWGPEEGPLVFCLHGILEHGASWELVAKPLAAQGFRVVAPDFRGHGRSGHISDGGSYHLLDFLGDVDAIARSLDRPFRLAGHSMGAAIAAMYASARPRQVAALILVEPPAPATPQNLSMADRLAVELDHLATPLQHPVFPDVAAAAERFCQAMPSIPSALVFRAAQRLTERCDGGVRWRWDARLRTRAGLTFDAAALTPVAYGEMLARITAPVTLVYGDGSDAGSESARETGAFARLDAQRVRLPGGHNVHLEAADALAALIAECPVTC